MGKGDNMTEAVLEKKTYATTEFISGKWNQEINVRDFIQKNYTLYEGSDALQQPAGRVGNPLDISNMVLFLCSDQASFITGENICIDGGMTKQMIYHNDNGWSLH